MGCIDCESRKCELNLDGYFEACRLLMEYAGGASQISGEVIWIPP